MIVKVQVGLYTPTNGIREPLEILFDQGLDSMTVFDRCERGKLIPIGELPEVANADGKVTQNAVTIYKSSVHPKKVYGYSVALLIHTPQHGRSEEEHAYEVSEQNLNIIFAANAFKVIGQAAETFITSFTPEARPVEHHSDFTHEELYAGILRCAESLFMCMHGISATPSDPASKRSAVVFVDEQYMDVAQQAFEHALRSSPFGRDKVYHIVAGNLDSLAEEEVA